MFYSVLRWLTLLLVMFDVDAAGHKALQAQALCAIVVASQI